MATKQTASRSQPLARVETRDWLRLIGIGFVVLGLIVAGYMTIVEVTGSEIACPGLTEYSPGEENAVTVNCSDVQSSAYAKLLGIPVAIIGLGGYLAIGLVLLLEQRVTFLTDYGRLLVFGMALFGFLYSAYLTYVEFFVIFTVCTWCLASAAIMTAIFAIATTRLVQYFRTPAES